MFSKKNDLRTTMRDKLNNGKIILIEAKNKLFHLNFSNINYKLVYLFTSLLFFISIDLFNLFSYYFIILYPGYITMNLVICNKFTLDDCYVEDREEVENNLVIDKVLTTNKIIKYNHILCYWLLFAFFFFLEHFIFIFKFIIPIYPMVKMLFIIWYLCGGNIERKNNLFYDFAITPIYQYILNIKKEYRLKKIT